MCCVLLSASHQDLSSICPIIGDANFLVKVRSPDFSIVEAPFSACKECMIYYMTFKDCIEYPLPQYLASIYDSSPSPLSLKYFLSLFFFIRY